MITIQKRIQDITSQENNAIIPNFVVISNTNNVLIDKQIPFYIETILSEDFDQSSIHIDIFETNFNSFSNTPLSNFGLRQYIQENGLKGASITSQSVASLQGYFNNSNLNITQFNVEPKYRGLSLGKLLLGTAEDLAVSKNCENLNLDIESICPKNISESSDRMIDKLKAYISNKVSNSFNNANRSQLYSFLENYGFETDSLSIKPVSRCVLQPDTTEKPGQILQVGLKGLPIQEILKKDNPTL